jgi:DNA polymerase-3 subunit gamma/tau
MDSEYKVFILDEVHALSNTAWQAMLKLIEEPPAKSIFIFCTTDAQKIPKTILSRVQRYDFKKISQEGIEDRLHYILHEVMKPGHTVYPEAVTYIAKLAEGGMRDSLTMLDKCLAYSDDLTLENVVKALGTADYDTMFALTNALFDKDTKKMIDIIENVHMSGIDLKQFVKQYTNFILDINKYGVTGSFDYIQIPATEENKKELSSYGAYEYDVASSLLSVLVKLNADIKWETSPKASVEATLMLECIKEGK